MINSRRLGDRSISEVFYPAGMRQDSHRHEYASFSFVSAGRYEEVIGRKSHSRTNATLIYHPAGERHAVRFESDVSILSVAFADRKIPDCLERGSTHCSELVAWLGARLGWELKRSDTASGLAIDGIIDELLAESSRRRGLGSGRWLTQATDYVHDNFMTSLTLEEIATVAGVNSAHLSRVFRQTMGCTVGDYVRRLRFEFASRQLVSTDRTLCEVAHDAGFSDQSHFHRLFKSRMGVTPHAYRKIHRSG